MPLCLLVHITSSTTLESPFGTNSTNCLLQVADHWYPKDSQAQARVDEYLEWQHLGTRMNCAGYFIARWLMPMTTKKFDEKAVAKAEKNMVGCLDDFERVWLRNGEKR